MYIRIIMASRYVNRNYKILKNIMKNYEEIYSNIAIILQLTQ